jgi:hypothetical protein
LSPPLPLPRSPSGGHGAPTPGNGGFTLTVRGSAAVLVLALLRFCAVALVLCA